jgi:RNA polymerase sigma-70 factor (ECF subfamily)
MPDENRAIQPEQLLAEAGWVRRLARRLVLDQAAADDVVQETWLRALEREADAPNRLRPWLGGIIRNIVRHAARDTARRTAREQAASTSESVSSAADVVGRAELHRQIVSAVLELAEPLRSTVLRRYFEELSAEEIARRDGIPASTVRNRLSRALDQLRRRFDQEFGDRRTWSLLLLPMASNPCGSPAGAMSSGGSRLARPRWLKLAGGLIEMSTKGKLVAAGLGVLLVLGIVWRTAGTTGRSQPAEAALAGPPLARAPIGSPSMPEVGATGAVTAITPDEPAVRTPLSASSSGSLHVEVVWGDDGQRAPGIRMRPWRVDVSSIVSSWTMPTRVTDEAGECSFESLPAGPLWITPDRCEGQKVDIVAGQQLDLRLAIPGGIQVGGVVIDLAGRPVPGAEVWVSDYGDSDHRTSVARTNDAGHFEIRDVAVGHYLTATAAGHGPSRGYLLAKENEPQVELSIELSAPGGGIDGSVRDPDGKPVADAVVLLEIEPLTTFSGSSRVAAPAFVTVSAGDGRFRFEDAPAVGHRVYARADGWSPWQGVVSVSTESRAQLEVNLRPPATVTGSVVEDTGAPVAGAHVGVDVYADLLWSGTVSGADGSFMLREVAEGSVALFASKEGVGAVKTRLTIAAGEEQPWRAVLSAGATIRGRILEASGQPAVDCSIVAVPQQGDQQRTRSAVSDADGRFVITNCKGVSDLQAFRKWGPMPLVVMSDVQPGSTEVTLTLPDPSLPGAFVAGRVSPPPGVPLVGGRAFLGQVSSPTFTDLVLDTSTGEVHGGPFPAGNYRVRIEVPGLPARQLTPLELRSGETLDLGVLEWTGPSRLTVRLHRAPGLDAVIVQLVGITDPLYLETLQVDVDVARSTGLQPGEYRLKTWGSGVASQSVPVRIGEGETTLELDVARGAWQSIAVDLGQTQASKLTLRVHDESGAVCSDAEFLMSMFDANQMPAQVGLCLKPGRYDLDVVLDGVVVLQEPLEVRHEDDHRSWHFKLP